MRRPFALCVLTYFDDAEDNPMPDAQNLVGFRVVDKKQMDCINEDFLKGIFTGLAKPA